MKTVNVKYLLPVKNGQLDETIQKRFLIETEQDIQNALDEKRIGILHLAGIRKYLERGEQVILSQSGGYCGAKGTWQIM